MVPACFVRDSHSLCMILDYEEEPAFEEEALEAVTADFTNPTEQLEEVSPIPQQSAQIDLERDPGSQVLLEHLDPNRQDIAQYSYHDPYRTPTDHDSTPTRSMDIAPHIDAASPEAAESSVSPTRPVQVRTLFYLSSFGVEQRVHNSG